MSSTDFVRAVVGGTLLGSQRWSVGFSLINESFGSLDLSAAGMTQLADAVMTSFKSKVWSASTGAWTAFVPASCTLDSVRTYLYKAGQRTASAQGLSTGASVAGTGTFVQAPQIAIVCTLLTNVPGRHNRGRIYLPACGLAVQPPTGQLSNTSATQFAQQIAAFCTDIKNPTVEGQNFYVAIASRTSSTPAQSVKATKVDTLFDTQQRRHDKMSATSFGTGTVTFP